MLLENVNLFAQIAVPDGVDPTAFRAGVIVGQLIGYVIGTAIGSLIGAIFLRWAVQWACKIRLTYGEAYIKVFILSIINFTVGLVLGFGAGLGGMANSPLAMLGVSVLSIIINLIFSCWYYGVTVKNAFGTPIGFGKGVQVTLVLLAIGIVLAIVIMAAVLVFAICVGTMR